VRPGKVTEPDLGSFIILVGVNLEGVGLVFLELVVLCGWNRGRMICEK